MTFNLGSIVTLLVAFQFTFMSVYLFANKKGNRRNNRILALVFLLFAGNMMDFSIRISGFILPISSLHLLDDCFFFLYGPALYFYTQGVVYHDFAIKRSDAFHLIPFILVTTFLASYTLLIEQDVQDRFAGNLVNGNLPVWIPVASLLIYAHILIYLWTSWRTIKKYQSVLKDNYSSIDGINLDWLSFMIRTFLGVALIGMINSFLPVFDHLILSYISAIAPLIISFYFINLVLVKALNQPAIFSGIRKDETAKYASSKLSENEIERYKRQVLHLMHADQLYLNAELRSIDLALKLDVSTKTLSQILNQGFNQNFFDFVNTFRCEELKKILQASDKKMTIIEAMYMSGFNSKSSFNKEFKKLTGQTPSEFKKSLS